MKRDEDIKGSPMLQRILSCEEMRIHCTSPLSNGRSMAAQLPYDFIDIPENTFAQQLTRMDMVSNSKLILYFSFRYLNFFYIFMFTILKCLG